MIKGKKVGAVIPAAGKGRRMGGAQSKQFLDLDGKPIIVYVIEHFQKSSDVDVIVLVGDKGNLSTLEGLVRSHALSKVSHIVIGGEQRQDSVWNGLQALEREKVDIVVVHDGVRPFIDVKMLHDVIEAAVDHGAAIAAVRAKETMKLSLQDAFVHETVDRNHLWTSQTPQAFDFPLLCRAYEQAIADGYHGTDDASLVERLKKGVKIVHGQYDNLKITTPEDIELAQLIMRRRNALIT